MRFRSILMALLLAVVPMMVVARAEQPAAAVGNFDNAVIADYAMDHYDAGDYGGQCRAFVNSVVAAATGINLAYGAPNNYFQAFEDNGAQRIMNVADLRKGDIVQQGNTESYAHLHTFIIISRVSGSTFNVIDSNHSLNEQVDRYNRAVTLDGDRRAYRLGKVSSSSNTAGYNNSPPSALHGDFDGDGRDDIFWYGPGTDDDTVWYGDTPKPNFDAYTSVDVDGDYKPFVGDFDGDGKSDVFWYGRGGGSDLIWFGRSNRGFTPVDGINVTGYYSPLSGDFDGDGYGDVFWYGPGSQPDIMWFGTSTRGDFVGGYDMTVSGTYSAVVGDFDGYGKSDIFWYGPGTASDVVWYGTATRGDFDAYTGVGVGGDYNPVPGDFDGDSRDDIFWYGPGNDSDTIWYGHVTKGTFTTGYDVTVSGNYRPAQGDFDGTGRSDIFWYGPNSNPDAVWYGAGTRGSFYKYTSGVGISGDYAPIS